MRKIHRVPLVATLIAMAMAVLLAAASAANAQPAFTATANLYPTVFKVGDLNSTVRVQIKNTGTTNVLNTNPVNVSFETPAGLNPRAVRLGNQLANCNQATLACTQAINMTPNTTTLPAELDLAVNPAAVDGSVVKVTVSGGGTLAPAVHEVPLTIQPNPGFGLHNLVATSFDKNKAADTEAQAGGHPFTANLEYEVNWTTSTQRMRRAVENPRSIVTDVPLGFIGNPQAAPTCTVTEMVGIPPKPTCPRETQVGIAWVDIGGDYNKVYNWSWSSVYNLEPEPGELARFGFTIAAIGNVFLVPELREDDNGIRIKAIGLPTEPQAYAALVKLFGVPGDPDHDAERSTCVFSCTMGGTTTSPMTPFLSNPHVCGDRPPTTTLHTDSWQNPGEYKSFSAEAAPLVDCDKPTFEPEVDIAPTTGAPDAPTGLDVDMRFPQEDNAEGLAPPPLKKAVVTLPEGMTISPSAADGLEACTDEQLKLKSKAPVTCPDAAKVGTVTAKSPALKETVSGGVYIRSQNSGDPESGEMFRLALVLENAERGISIRLPGSVRANKDTGRLETTFDNNPQLPVSEIELRLKQGPRAPLAMPATCGEKTIDTQLTAWNGKVVDLESKFDVDCGAGAGGFAPGLVAGSTSTIAGAFSPFEVQISRPDGQQFLEQLKLDLPKGLLAKVGDVPLCGDADANAGTCGEGSRIGTATVAAGPGSNPFQLSGGAYLTGPYKGAPYGMSVAVRVVAGPFDLGTVVVRQALHVDPSTAQVTVVSDALPTIVKGVPVRLRTAVVDVDRPQFTRNPTSCAEKQAAATFGSQQGSSAQASSRFQVDGCRAMKFAPQLKLALTGKRQTKTGRHPGVNATVTQTGLDEAGIERAEVTLPKSLALDPQNAQALCEFDAGTKPDLEKRCPKGSIVGRATAVTPLLSKPLTGNVYFVKNVRKDAKTGNTLRTLPMIVVALRGEISINLKGESSTTKAGRLVNTFASVPDAPITRFDLRIAGGKHGILAVTRTRTAKIDLCAGRHVAETEMDGQNGRSHDRDVRMKTPCSKKQTKAAKRAAKRAAKARNASRR